MSLLSKSRLRKSWTSAGRISITVCAYAPSTVSHCLDDIRNILVGISRIPKSQAEMLPNATEAIPGDEEHYVVELDVFHQLHCLVSYSYHLLN